MYKKEILKEIGGYDLSYTYYDDWFLTFRYLAQSDRVSVIKECLTIFVNDHREDRLTLIFDDKKRKPFILRYYLEILNWLVEERKDAV